MPASNRRTFLRAATSAVALQQAVLSQVPPAGQRVFLTGDGVNLPPAEYARLLSTLDAKADVYLKGGAVEELEGRFAKLPGKEKALFFPTGTLAITWRCVCSRANGSMC